MRRTIAVVLPLLFCLAILVLWARSYRVYDTAVYQRIRVNGSVIAINDYFLRICDGGIYGGHNSASVPFVVMPGADAEKSKAIIEADSKTFWEGPPSREPASGRHVSLLLIAVIFGLVPPLSREFRSNRLRQRRLREGLCLKCGYNLFGSSSGVCPECGSHNPIRPQSPPAPPPF